MKIRKKKRRAPVVVSSRPLLSLAMMVRDEEALLADALRRARGWVDEMVVVDTGSTDRTVEIARDLGATVSHFEWCDSFSAARNVTLRRSAGRYVAILDADERFVGAHPEAIRRHLRPGPAWPFEALSVKVSNTRLDGAPISDFFSVRFFPNDPRLGYSGRVHNRFGALGSGAPKVSVSQYLGLGVVHLGYDPALYVARKKAARSLPLIEATVREEPQNWQYRYYLGREYLTLGRHAEAIDELGRAVEGFLGAPEPGALAESTTSLLQAGEAAGVSPEVAVGWARRSLGRVPDHPDVWLGLGRALVRAGQRAEAAAAVERAVAGLGSATRYAQVQLGAHPWEAHELLAALYWELGRYPEAYRAFLAALGGKPVETAGWPGLLNSVCALAIELGDEERKPALLERLMAHPEAPLGMFFFEVERVLGAQGAGAARALLASAASQHPRVLTDPEYGPLAARLG